MADRCYLGVWTRDLTESTLLEQFVRFLAAAPLAASKPWFTQLTVQPIDASLAPVAEWDLRGQGFGAAEVAALAAQCLHADTAYMASAEWDLWQFAGETMKWERRPSPLTITCQGPEYDEGTAAVMGNFLVDLGFEHLFTGHEGLLGGEGAGKQGGGQPEDPAEHTFLRWMSTENNRREYHEKTRENIEHLMDWIAAIELALPVERTELWSEGEENFEARLDTILVQR
ncbi:MAG TPA: hypothetical protein VHE23_01190 [Candidatus Acidoferrales bacterium]|nr:hypothetical protein [Candidatus Acidoferrales bacterium]